MVSDAIRELKYSFPKSKEGLLLRRLGVYARTPRMFSRAHMRTIYFDSEDGVSYFDACDGHLLRRKYRLREYIGPDKEGACYSLEVKVRFDQKTTKIKVLVYKPLPGNYRITNFSVLVDDLRRLCDVDVSPIVSYALGRYLRPVAAVTYERFRFESQDGDVRYNLDRNIYVYPRVRDLYLHAGFSSGQGIGLDYDIFETKARRRVSLPYFLRHCGLEPLSLSKFIWARELLFNYQKKEM